MVINFTNINKTNNHFSSELTEQNKVTTTYEVGHPGSGFGQAQKCGSVKPANDISTCCYFRMLEYVLSKTTRINDNQL